MKPTPTELWTAQLKFWPDSRRVDINEALRWPYDSKLSRERAIQIGILVGKALAQDGIFYECGADLDGTNLAGAKGLETVIGFGTVKNLDKARR